MNRLSLYQIIFLIAGLYCLLLNRVAASDIFFEHIQFSDPSKQKALNDLSVISQDHDGFMWFGGMQRLVRYDGIELKTYGPSPKDPDNLCGTFVQALFLDYQGILWVGAEHALCRYEKSLDIFVPFSGEGIKIVKSPSNSNATSNLPTGEQKLSFAYALFEDGKHNLYIGENGRLLKLNALRNELSIYSLPDYMVSQDHISSIRSLYEDKDGQIWVGTSDSGLGKFDPQSETFHFYPHGRTDGTGTRGHRINSITQDVDGKLWLGQYLAGIDTFDPRTGEFSPQNIIQSSGSDSVWAIQQDKNHNIWMSSDGGGLLRYKPETKKVLTYRHQDGNPFSLIEDKTIGLYVDSDNNVWISQYPEGISYYHRNTEAIWNYKKTSAPNEPTLNDNGVLSFLELPNGNIFIGTEKGLNEYNPKTEKFKNWSDENTAQLLPQKPMTSIARDSSGNIWIGTWSAGIFRFNSHMQELKHFIADGQSGSLGANIVWDILPLENGEVVIATQGAGLNRYDPILDKFIDVRTEAALPQGAPEDLYCVIRDKNNRLWIGGTNGLHRFDPIEKSIPGLGRMNPQQNVWKT